VALPSKTLGRDTRLENLCTFLFTPFPRKGAGKGYQVRKLPLFTPFPRKGAGKGYQVRKLVSIPVP